MIAAAIGSGSSPRPRFRDVPLPLEARGPMGPRRASWSVGCLAGADRDAAHREAARLIAARTIGVTITRREVCPACDGDGQIWRRGRGRPGSSGYRIGAPCPSHVRDVTTIERFDVDAARRASTRRDAIRDGSIDLIWPDDPATSAEVAAHAHDVARPDPLGNVAAWRVVARDRMLAECGDGGIGVAARLAAIEADEYQRAGRPW